MPSVKTCDVTRELVRDAGRRQGPEQKGVLARTRFAYWYWGRMGQAQQRGESGALLMGVGGSFAQAQLEQAVNRALPMDIGQYKGTTTTRVLR